MKWTERLESNVYQRLCNCQIRKSDIDSLVDAKWGSMKEAGQDKNGFTKEDALVSVLELLDSNGQSFDLTVEEYENLSR